MSLDTGTTPAQSGGTGVGATAEGTTPATTSSGAIPGSTMEIVRPPAYGRGIVVSIVAAAAVFALAIMASGETPTATGVPLTETTNPLFWGLAVIFAVMTGVGAQYSEFTAARAAESLGSHRRRSSLPTAWAVPFVAELTAILMVATYHNTLMLVAGPAIAFLGVAGGLLARDLLDDAIDSSQRTASTIHTLIIHLIAFLALSAVYLNKMSGWVSAPLVALLSGILILEALDRGGLPVPQRILYALLGAGVMAQAAIVINWWPTHGWTGGAALLVCFFAICGVLTAHVERKSIGERELIEYGLVSAVGLIILAFTL
jgi:hypothetical protein